MPFAGYAAKSPDDLHRRLMGRNSPPHAVIWRAPELDRRDVSSVQTSRLHWNLHCVLFDRSRLGQRDLQYASGEERLHRLGVRLERQSDRTCKLAERPLLMAVVAVLQAAVHP